MPTARLERAAGPADLLVVGDRRARALVVDDEREVGLVEAHAERGGGDDGLDLVGEQRVLDYDAVVVLALAAVGHGVDALRAQPAGDPLGVGDGEAVDDAGPGQLRDDVGEPRQPLRGLGQVDDRRGARLVAVERAADDLEVVAELLDDVVDDPVVGRRGRAQHRHAVAAAARARGRCGGSRAGSRGPSR